LDRIRIEPLDRSCRTWSLRWGVVLFDEGCDYVVGVKRRGRRMRRRR
jgi:hypothetical protein